MQKSIEALKDQRWKDFWNVFSMDRAVLRDFYINLSDDRLDYRMMDTPTRKSDSPRESLIHLIRVQMNYLNGVEAGTLRFEKLGMEEFKGKSKKDLLDSWQSLDDKLFNLLLETSPNKEIVVPWGKDTAMSVLYAMHTHDILHTGWNLALMDHLEMPRYESSKRVWGE